MADWVIASCFLKELSRRAEGRRQLSCSPQDLVAWYHAAFATEAVCQDARSKVRRLLDTLAEAQVISLPKGREGWLPFPPPMLPRWIRFAAEAKSSPDQRHRTYPWGPELAFVAGMPAVPHLDVLLAINTWLRDGGREQIQAVPLRERSIEITGDEKILEDVVRCQSLQSEDGGGVTLELLRAYLAPPPLAFERGPGDSAGKPILVLENAHTWHSFAVWNRNSARYAAVVYGNGKMFAASVSRVGWIIETTAAARDVRYFGDLDIAGLLIPIEAGEAAYKEGLPVPTAEGWLYEELLKHPAQPISQNQPGGACEDMALLSWLPSDLRVAAQDILRKRLRIAQEYVGTAFLHSIR